MNKDSVISKINEIKEVLSNMPQNNKVNRNKYLNYMEEMLNNYNNIKKNIVNEIKKRYDDISNRENRVDIDIENKYREKEECFNYLWIIDSNNSSYEKVGLDKLIFNINKYYEEDIESLNKVILNVINCFFKVGIKLTLDDFYYSYYLRDYMNVLLNNKDESKLKEKFDEVYWKCPNIINQIAMNFASLYYKYEKIFNDYFDKEKNRIIKNDSVEEIINKYNINLESINDSYYSINNISKRFLSGEDNIKDFSNDKYNNYIESICEGEVAISDFEKLNNTLYEYSIYLKYKYLIDEVVNIYKEKDKYKNSFKSLKNEILREEKKIIKINKKIAFQSKWGKNNNKIEMLNITLNNIIDGLKEKYDDLELQKIMEILSNTSDNLSYFDILQIVANHFIFLRNILKKNDENIDDKTVDDVQLELLNFLIFNKLTILDNVFVLDDCNLATIISNKYKLSKFKINENDMDSNVDNYIELLRKVKIIESINKSDVSYNELLFQVRVLPIIK